MESLHVDSLSVACAISEFGGSLLVLAIFGGTGGDPGSEPLPRERFLPIGKDRVPRGDGGTR